ncbi:uncharacterized protein LOC123707950 [Pieris brassicae]|uniref:DUF4781 domain-containing protein n=1 Tax=Pieris brassicae TaxID=7116 RepID=A0A9P0SJ75_PIEBR|nr:uncharacterized protein LOC123707950 [Pieris brassicae]CAH3849904.1 unnamed protein product [Pieris brassicae]
MEVDEDKWVTKAIENVEKYLNRGGALQGDIPQFLGGSELLNTIGMAMGLPICNPTDWSQYELKQALSGQLVFFKGKSLEAINAVAETIRSCCNGDDKNYITVLPIELYFQGKLYELPIFRAHRYRDSKKYYVDNTGRYYDSVSDWYDNNKLPPCRMGYPADLTLKLRPGYTYPHIYLADTPPKRVGPKTARVVDTVSAVAGISSGVGLLFASGGLAAPFVVAGVASAVWGSARASNTLYDRASHGESVNPFTNSESRMLWLGIAANIASFGAMGATMRLTSLAARGRDVSNALRIFTNIANGTTLTLSTLAIINNSLYLIQHYDELSSIDVLMHLASVAFWTKGVFTYKTAGTLIREAEIQAFNNINKELSPEVQRELNEVRGRIQNDASLLRQFIAASQSQVSIQEYSQVLIDGMHYYDTVNNMSPEQIEAFASLRNVLSDDMHLIRGLQRVSDTTNLNRQGTVELVLDMWQRYADTNFGSTGDVTLRGGNLVLGSAPPIQINQMPDLSVSMIRFFGEHLSRIDGTTTNNWSVPDLLILQSRGLFTTCQATGVCRTGHATISLNGKLEISVKKLMSLKPTTCEQLFGMISRLTDNQCSTASLLPADLVKLCVRELRLRFEVHRRESVEWATRCVSSEVSLRNIVQGDLMPHERDRLYTFRADVDMVKADLYMSDLIKFVAEKNPRNVSELVAYSEFVMTYIEEVSGNILEDLNEGRRQLPNQKKKKVWIREQAAREVFENTSAMTEKLNDLLNTVSNNDMVGVQTVGSGLSDTELVAAIRSNRIRFGGRISAAYHIYKHSTDPVSAYVDQANSTIRLSSDQYTVTIGQEGNTRLISFTDDNGSCIVLESNGRVLLCSFRATGRQ